MSVQDNLTEINHLVAQACQKVGRSEEEINIIAVTKYVTIETAKEAIEAGIHHLGENRIEGILNKQAKIESEDVNWHFIGTLQSRKVKDVVDHISMLHSLDRMSVAKQIESRASQPIDCFVQVNVSGESTKHGLKLEDVTEFIQSLETFEKIRIVGLMTMAPHIDDQVRLRSVFKKLREKKEEIEALHIGNAPCHYLSMGMSNDFEIAIEEGATHIRIGTKLVGSELKGV